MAALNSQVYKCFSSFLKTTESKRDENYTAAGNAVEILLNSKLFTWCCFYHKIRHAIVV
jgi:hypothetical protein